MNIYKSAIPTGYVFVGEYSRGNLETLSIGDYGKHKNVKADFLGYTKPINGVSNDYCMPLTEKWVVTVSSQYGCPQSCTFCDVPNIKFMGNATTDDLRNQLYNAISLFPVKYTERLNLHYARMGEPIYNDSVFEFSEWIIENKGQIYRDTGLRIEVIHPVLTTSMPNSLANIGSRIHRWCDIKNQLYRGQAGLQLSINSTNDIQRDKMFGGKSLTLDQISEICKNLPDPISRKYCLNFAYSTDFEIDARKLRTLFNPETFMCKITPIHNNHTCKHNGIETIGGYTSYAPYIKPEEDLKSEGFDVLVFIPSMDEEDSTVTCGNAILGGGTICTNDIIKIKGISND